MSSFSGKFVLLGVPLSRRHSFCLFCHYLDDLPTTHLGYTTSLRISWAYEYQGQYQKAVILYLEAVNCLSETQDNLNIGSVYHQLGNCFAYMGDFAKAIDYYLQAVECFAPLDFGQFLSISMSELGLVTLEAEFTSSLKKAFNRDLIFMGLKDVGDLGSGVLERDSSK